MNDGWIEQTLDGVGTGRRGGDKGKKTETERWARRVVSCWGMGTPADLPPKHDAASLTHLVGCRQAVGHVSDGIVEAYGGDEEGGVDDELIMGCMVGMRKI